MALQPNLICQRFFWQNLYGKDLNYDAVLCAFTARLARLSWAMLHDGRCTIRVCLR